MAFLHKIAPYQAAKHSPSDISEYLINMMPKDYRAEGRRIKKELQSEELWLDHMEVIKRCAELVEEVSCMNVRRMRRETEVAEAYWEQQVEEANEELTLVRNSCSEASEKLRGTRSSIERMYAEEREMQRQHMEECEELEKLQNALAEIRHKSRAVADFTAKKRRAVSAAQLQLQRE